MKNTTALTTLLFCLALTLHAQDEGFIYGKVYMIDDKTYEGPIRWGKEEVYWTDVFNSAKETNENLRYLSSRERDALDERQFSWTNWDNNGPTWRRWVGWASEDRDYRHDYTHQFACQFGEIKTLEPTGRKHAELVMQNGKKITVSGEGYNDIGLDIRVVDPDMGSVDIDWGRISKIEFMKTPKNLSEKFGKPMYGTVEANGEKFTGYIQWDHDERLSIDKLDGDSDEGNLSIEFDKIQSIERRGWYSQVTLKSGRQLRMDGSNDVNDGNRGIIVENKDFVAIDIPWREFDKVTFTDAPAALATYDQFSTQRELIGTITTRDEKTLSGKIVFDLDEEFEYELLQGKQREIEYVTAFRNIKKLEKQNSYSPIQVELKTGVKFTLGDAQDVNEKNQGILIFSGKSDPVYIEWDDIRTIEFSSSK